MAESPPASASASPQGSRQPAQPIVIQQEAASRRRWGMRFLVAALILSVLMNISMFGQYQEYFSGSSSPMERYRSGAKEPGADKIAVIEVSGTIMPPFTERILKQIKAAQEDDRVKGVVLTVDSPGGLVADSHQIYHRLVELREVKPIVVAFQRIAASGGYYVAMGAGPDAKIFVEPTTWTGSIGVMIPRYDLQNLAEKVGIDSEPLVTGEFKDSLSPFRELTEAEREVWKEIIDDAFERFITVIEENRGELDRDAVLTLATGQIYTAAQARDNKMVDEFGYEDDAIQHLQQQLGLEDARIVTYQFQPGLLELLTGTMQARDPATTWKRWLEATVPQAMYYCSWGLGVPGW